MVPHLWPLLKSAQLLDCSRNVFFSFCCRLAPPVRPTRTLFPQSRDLLRHPAATGTTFPT
jgi:hypothetical protein